MGSYSTQPSSEFFIPSVDISPYLADPSSDAARHAVDQIGKALRTSGFFQLYGHGVPRQVQKAAFDASKRFFALPADVKMKYAASIDSGWKGYEVLGGQSYEPGMLGDLKEGLALSKDLPEGHPLRGVRGRFLTSIMRWPEELGGPDEFRSPVEAYCDAVSALCSTILDAIADTLPYGRNIFDDMKKDAACPLRLLHYPPASEGAGDTDKQHGASAHTDFSALTLLLQDENAGLEIYDPSSKKWHLIEPKTDAYVVNLGDMMIKLFGDQYKSGLHRVINRAPAHRYSIVYFFDGNRDFKLRRLGQGPDGAAAAEDEEEVMTCEEYLFHKIRSTYSRHSKHDLK
jgi:isopenicillin N synthase-like dioxygenase